MIHLTFPSSETAWPHLVNTFWWFVSSEQRVLQRWAVLRFKISEALCSHKHKLAKVCPWRHFPLNHSDCSNPCRPQLATTTTFPCGLFRMWFKSLRCDCDFPHNIEEFPRRDKQGKYIRKHFSYCIIGSDSRSPSAKGADFAMRLKKGHTCIINQ